MERIVDQVVNPKLNTNFVPKIEDVSYAYLGIEKPENRPLTIDINSIDQQPFLPNLDLEQVSPESSEKSPSLIEEKEDLESPAFEVITAKSIDLTEEKIVDTDDDKMDISDDSNEVLNKSNEETNTNDGNKSNLSSISGLTSNESIGEILEETEVKPIPNENALEKVKIDTDTIKMEMGEIEIKQEVKGESDDKVAPVVQEIQLIDVGEQPDEKPSIHYSGEVESTNQDSVLSQVSSNSRLSIITNTRLDGADDGSTNNEEAAADSKKNTEEKNSTCPYGISEEAQMQQFNESSSSSNGLMIDTDQLSNGDNKIDDKPNEQVTKAFDIEKEEIKFEGTERKSFDVDTDETNQNLMEKLNLKDKMPSPKDAAKFIVSNDAKNESFNSSNGDISKTEEIESPKPDEILLKTETNSGLDDSKEIEDSNSSGSKSKDKSSSMSSSSQRSLVDTDPKNKSKDRHGSSSSSKDRHKSDKDKRSHSNHLSSRSGEGKHFSGSSSNSRHRHESSSSKSHRKSSSSSSFKRDSSRDKDKYRSHSDLSKKSTSGSHRNSSCSSHRDRKHDSKSSDRKSKNDSQRSSISSTKKDDHSSYKEKPLSRQRSRSKDSNDGNSNPNSAPNNPESNVNITNPPAVSDEKQSTEQQQTSTNTSPISQSDCPEIREPSSPTISTFSIPLAPAQNQNDFVMTTQPIVVDQILTGSELNLEMFIDENRGDPVVSKIEHSLTNQVKIKKPKVAANIHEARKLMKIRKQIDRDEQKKIEKAKVLAKQYIRTNATAVSGDDCQGVELEFACINSGAGPSIAGPSISSPVKVLPSPDKMDDKTTIDDHFTGFTEQDFINSRAASEYLNDIINKLKMVMLKTKKKSVSRRGTPDVDGNQSEIISNEQINEIFSGNESHKLFLENNRLQDANKIVGNRKRKLTESSTTSDDAPNAKILAESDEVANVVANVIISSQTPSTATKSETSTNRSGKKKIKKCFQFDK